MNTSKRLNAAQVKSLMKSNGLNPVWCRKGSMNCINVVCKADDKAAFIAFFASNNITWPNGKEVTEKNGQPSSGCWQFPGLVCSK